MKEYLLRSRARIFIIAAFVLAAVVYYLNREGASPESQQPAFQAQTAVVAVEIKNFSFFPAETTIKSGDTVEWVNRDSAPHSIKSDIFNSEILNKGALARFKFDDKGTYGYVCGIHPTMRGKIIVE